MIEYIVASKADVELFMQSRLEMLKVVNDLPSDFCFDNELIEKSREYFEKADQTTVLALDGETVIGCTTLCYIELLPTFSHPTGKRAHLMNVYTNDQYRRQGIASRMMQMVIHEAKAKRVTEISLDATESGRPLYKKFGFVGNDEGMVLTLREDPA